jgi:hypothetical protein
MIYWLSVELLNIACNLAIARLRTSAEEGRNDKKCLELHGGGRMVSVTFWTLNPDVSPSKIAEVAAKLMQKGLWPPKGMKVLGFYVCPGGRGVTISEVEGANEDEIAFEGFVAWTKELPGIFASYETMPAVTAEKGVEITLR